MALQFVDFAAEMNGVGLELGQFGFNERSLFPCLDKLDHSGIVLTFGVMELPFQGSALLVQLTAPLFAGCNGHAVLGQRADDALVFAEPRSTSRCCAAICWPSLTRLPCAESIEAANSASWVWRARNWLRREIRPVETLRGPTVSVPSGSSNSPASVT